jgi:hypothetical protein
VIHITVVLALVVGLFIAAGVLHVGALLITDAAHRLRGDVRCGPGCPCRGSLPR